MAEIQKILKESPPDNEINLLSGEYSEEVK